MNYDYIGAPVPIWHWPKKMNTRVGNGGLSLRKISSMLRVLKNKADIFQKANFNDKFAIEFEDKFLSYCTTVNELHFRSPTLKQALDFSVEFNICGIHKRISHLKEIPFGCHGWYVRNFQIWRPLITNMGYHINEDDVLRYSYEHDDNLSRRVFNRVIRLIKDNSITNTQKRYVKEAISCALNGYQTYSIWGYGKNGRKCVSILKMLGFKCDHIYDSKLCKQKKTEMHILEPTKSNIIAGNNIMIVATGAHELATNRTLLQYGLQRNKDFLLYSDFCYKISASYYKQLFKINTPPPLNYVNKPFNHISNEQPQWCGGGLYSLFTK